jgi:hypothetical protein
MWLLGYRHKRQVGLVTTVQLVMGQQDTPMPRTITGLIWGLSLPFSRKAVCRTDGCSMQCVWGCAWTTLGLCWGVSVLLRAMLGAGVTVMVHHLKSMARAVCLKPNAQKEPAVLWHLTLPPACIACKLQQAKQDACSSPAEWRYLAGLALHCVSFCVRSTFSCCFLFIRCARCCVSCVASCVLYHESCVDMLCAVCSATTLVSTCFMRG